MCQHKQHTQINTHTSRCWLNRTCKHSVVFLYLRLSHTTFAMNEWSQKKSESSNFTSCGSLNNCLNRCYARAKKLGSKYLSEHICWNSMRSFYSAAFIVKCNLKNNFGNHLKCLSLTMFTNVLLSLHNKSENW